jgi:hypothetical protein
MIRHILFWFVLMIIGVLNGILRVSTYGTLISDLSAHQLSTILGMILTGLAAWGLWKRWPLKSIRQAWIVGLLWLSFTILFEFGFGHIIAGHSWQHLISDYNLLNGRIWSLFLVWIQVMPPLFFSVSTEKFKYIKPSLNH